MKSDLGFLIEIHTEDGFLESEIRFRISRLIAKSEIRISQLNATRVSWVHTFESKPPAQEAAH